MKKLILVVFILFTVGCESDPEENGIDCKSATTTHCIEIAASDAEQLLVEVNSLKDSTTIILGKGTFSFNNQVTIRGANDVTLMGQGMEDTILDFASQTTQSNGVDAIANNFTLSDLTVQDAKKDGIRIEDSDGVTIERVRVTWSGGPKTTNGAYGIYPVKSKNILVANSEAYNASDAGLYIGQCINGVIRNNYAKNNVAGIEIENSQYINVYNNIAEENTGGLLIFDLPGNPIAGRDIWVHDNIIRNNNIANFAPGGTVSAIPAGTGTIILATRRLELSNNTYSNNNTTDIAVMSGLVIEEEMDLWALTVEEMLGTYSDLNLPTAPCPERKNSTEDCVYNYRTEEIYLHGNTFSGSGTNGDASDPENREIGVLLKMIYKLTPIDNMLYGGIGESSFSASSAAGNSNDNHFCIAESSSGTLASLNLEVIGPRAGELDFADLDELYRPGPPFEPFNCTGFTLGDIQTSQPQ